MTSWRHRPYALKDNSQSPLAVMQIMRGNVRFLVVKIAGNACAANTIEIRDSTGLHKFPGSASRLATSETRGADSESGFLATKKFSGKSR